MKGRFRLPCTESGRALLVFSLLLVSYGYFFPRLNNWESNSRMDLVYALGDEGTVPIDDYHLNTGDKAYFEGHYYMEKSIGPSLAGLPAYVAFRGLVRLPPLASLARGGEIPGALPSIEQVYARYHLPEPGEPGAGHPPVYHAMALTFVTFFTVAILSALLGSVVYLMAARFSASPRNAFALALVFGLGTPALAYSNEFYQHQPGAFGAFAGFVLLWGVIEGASRRFLWLVGILFGYAIVSEYVLAPILAGVLVWALFRIRPARHLLPVAFGAAPWVIATVVYNLVAFSSPLPIGYRYSTFASAFESRTFGLVPPSWDSVYGITFSPYRGLFFLSPFLLLGPIGLYSMIRRRGRTRELAIVLLLICVSLFAFISCYWAWSGGDSIGPRFLVPMLPFLCLPIIFVLDIARKPWQRAALALLAAVSVAAIWIEFLAGTGFPPETVHQPLTDHALPLLRLGEVRFSLASILGLRGLATLIPLVLLLVVTVVVVTWLEGWWLRRRVDHPMRYGADPAVDREYP